MSIEAMAELRGETNLTSCISHDAVTKNRRRPWDLPSVIYRLIHVSKGGGSSCIYVLTLLHTQTCHQMMRMSTAATADWVVFMFETGRPVSPPPLEHQSYVTVYDLRFVHTEGCAERICSSRSRDVEVLEKLLLLLLSPRRSLYHQTTFKHTPLNWWRGGGVLHHMDYDRWWCWLSFLLPSSCIFVSVPSPSHWHLCDTLRVSRLRSVWQLSQMTFAAHLSHF